MRQRGKRKGKNSQGEGTLKEAQSDGGTNYREVYQSHALFHHLPFSHSCLAPFSSPLVPSAPCSNPLAGLVSSFCILIPPQRGADNLGRGFFKLAPLTRCAARWVSYRNNFRAPFPHRTVARGFLLFFPPRCLSLFLLHSSVFIAYRTCIVVSLNAPQYNGTIAFTM